MLRADRRRRTDRGSTLIEVTMAIALLAMVATGVVRHIASSQRATFHARISDEATTVAYDFLERSRAFGCGLEVGGEAGLDEKHDKCGGLGIVSTTDSGTVLSDYEVTVATAWVMSSTDDRPASCAAFQTGNPKPNMLIRDITVKWQARGVNRTIESSTVEAIPGDAVPFNSEIRGGFVVRARSADSVIGLVDPGGTGHFVYRPAVKHGDEQCVWFPFLLPGAYSVLLSDGGARTVTVSTGATVCRDETTWASC